MEISAANLTALFTGFDVVFQRGFEKPPSYYEQITSVVRSASRQTTYPWLGRTTKFREWLGDRVVQALETHAYTIVNKNFEDTVAIDRNDIEDDTYGAYEPVIEQLGWDTKVHPDMLLFQMIKNSVANPGSDITHWFELSVAPWFGMALCDQYSYPQSACKPKSDTNAPHGGNSGTMAGDTGQSPPRGPAAVPVHDNGDVQAFRECTLHRKATSHKKHRGLRSSAA